MNRKKLTKYYDVVYGASGVGKSTIVDSAIQGRKGVLKIEILSATIGIMNEVAKVIGVTKLNPQIGDLVDAMMKTGVADDGTFPTIVFEIERGKSEVQKIAISEIMSFAKKLSPVCNCILVLSEANVVLEFGNDTEREGFIFVDEFSELEAREYLKAMTEELKDPKVELSETDVKNVIDNIGANPAAFNRMLTMMTNDGLSVGDFVELKLRDARAHLKAFPHKAILKALKEHPDGISPGYFNNAESKGVDLSNPRAVAVAMKVSNVLAYRIELDQYIILSHCHKVALRTYEPKVPLPPVDVEKQINELRLKNSELRLKVEKLNGKLPWWSRPL